MKMTLISISIVFLLTGCNLTESAGSIFNKEPEKVGVKETGITKITASSQSLQESKNFQAQYQPQLIGKMNNRFSFNSKIKTKNLNHYVRGLMQDLVENLEYVNESTPIAVTSFVFLDGSFESSNLLGNQIAESLIHEVHKFGIPVLDFKTTDYIRVTKTGDFILSRDFLELTPNLSIKYVVVGTLVNHQGGYLVNARIVGIKSKAVVASAQSFVPTHIADALLDSGQRDGIPIERG